MRTILRILLPVLLVVSACGLVENGDPTTTEAPEPEQPSASAADDNAETFANEGESQGPVSVNLTTCEDPGDFEILCQAYDYLILRYVDPLDNSVLAAGAVRGIEEFLSSDAGHFGGASVSCPLPSDAFGVTCEAAALALSTFDTTPASVAEAAVYGLYEYGLDDPNSRYLSPAELMMVLEDQSGTISGIGTYVSTQEEDEAGDLVQCNVISDTCKMSIASVVEESPAEDAGLMSGDVMVTVDGQSLIGWTSDQIGAAVRGPEGEEVTIEISRDGEILRFTIVRAVIAVSVATSELKSEGIGYVRLTRFTDNSGTLFRAELEKMISAGATSLIIDFRNNPGGALDAAISVASEFLVDGLVLRTEAPGGGHVYKVVAGGVATSAELEIVVLVNRWSASASEVVAGVLQETDRAVVIGEPTFGKNTVQQQYGLSNGGAVRVTISRWLTPSGLDFGVGGLAPDITVEYDEEAPRTYLIDAAIAYLSGS